jgi:hypothetical protein
MKGISKSERSAKPSQTRICGRNHLFARDAQETLIVPYNPLLLAYFRCHHCLKVIHSGQCIRHVLKYCSKNSDASRISVQNVLYEGYSVSKSDKLHYYAATRVSSASECFAGICGFWRHHIKPTVQFLGIHLPGKKIVLRAAPVDPVESVGIPSPIEKYLGRPTDSSFDHLTYLDYHSWYFIVDHPTSPDTHPNVYNPVRFPNSRKEQMLCVINFVHPKNHQLFAMRLLLRRFPARTWGQLRTVDDEICQNVYDAVRQLGLVANQDQEAEICLQDAIDLNRPLVTYVSYWLGWWLMEPVGKCWKHDSGII